MSAQSAKTTTEKSLRHVVILSGLDEAELAKVEARCKWRWCKPGQLSEALPGPAHRRSGQPQP